MNFITYLLITIFHANIEEEYIYLENSLPLPREARNSLYMRPKSILYRYTYNILIKIRIDVYLFI